MVAVFETVVVVSVVFPVVVTTAGVLAEVPVTVGLLGVEVDTTGSVGLLLPVVGVGVAVEGPVDSLGIVVDPVFPVGLALVVVWMGVAVGMVLPEGRLGLVGDTTAVEVLLSVVDALGGTMVVGPGRRAHFYSQFLLSFHKKGGMEACKKQKGL